MYNRKKKPSEQPKPHYKKEEASSNQSGAQFQNNGRNPQEKHGESSGNKKKKRNFWRNRFKNKRGNNDKKTDFSDKRDNSHSDKNKQSRYPQKPVVLPEEIMGLERIENSIFNLEPPPVEEGEKSEFICPICEKPIKHLDSAILHQPDGQPAHFECVIKEIVENNRNHLGRHRRIYYIGSGQFAVVKELYDRRGRVKSYQVIHRIPYEKQENS